MKTYFERMDAEIHTAYALAEQARAKGLDPDLKPDIAIAKNIGQRVEGLLSIFVPEILNSGVAERIVELERDFGALSWDVALLIADEVYSKKFCAFKSDKEAMDTAIRAGFAYHTLGIVSAPLEGFVETRIKKRADGKEYVSVAYAGPVRGAGGTAVAFSILLADYMRKKAGFAAYDPAPQEISRFATELYDYHDRVTNLQYKPTPEEIAMLVRNIPVEIDGDASEDIEVSNYKDLPRIATNKIRSGVCLALSMVALKAPKLWKEIQRLERFGFEWNFMRDFIDLQKKARARTEKSEKLSPDHTFISDLVAGRPVLTHPLAAGGFRMRYGRTRMSGYSAAGLHPATMAVLRGYIATGTQLKLERPGKAAAITTCDSIEGPIVKLKNGSVLRLETEQSARTHLTELEEILFLGDILISYGDFYDRAHPLIPAGYVEEWWQADLEKALLAPSAARLCAERGVSEEELTGVVKGAVPSARLAFEMSKALAIPLHPRYTYYWSLIGKEQFRELVEWMDKAAIEFDTGIKIVVPLTKAKRTLDLIGLPHMVVNKEYVVIEGEDAFALLTVLDLTAPRPKLPQEDGQDDIRGLTLVNLISPVQVMDKAGTFIGARMGRPEKAKMRRMSASPHTLFPVGKEGGRLRSFQEALSKGFVASDFPLYKCCDIGIYMACSECGKKAQRMYSCSRCGITEKRFCHGTAFPFQRIRLDITKHYGEAVRMLERAGLQQPEMVKGVRGTSSKEHTPEHLVKGLLRARHSLAVNKDGTIRYDMTELPLTHFTPAEIGTPVDVLREMGYEKDIHGSELKDPCQLLELFCQDIILPAAPELGEEAADAFLLRVAMFIDELLMALYQMPPFYNITSKKELVGQLVVGIAPHISAGVIGRVIGFSQTQTLLAHPLFHAAMRRDADGDEASVILLLDALLNFSRQYLPDSRGSRTMDAPLVLTTSINPREVDDMVHRLDVAWRYPAELYEAGQQFKMPWQVKVPQFSGLLKKENAAAFGVGFTHSSESVNQGTRVSSYKTLPSMEEKLKGQMILAETIRAVNTSDVARLVIEKHFLKDIKGNLRQFSTQQFRCSGCNKKFRRPPLQGKCDDCGDKLLFTVSEGNVTKYLELAIRIAEKYNASPYLKQSLELTKRRVEEVFGKEAEKQEGLVKWVG